jgi:hypothetical protein
MRFRIVLFAAAGRHLGFRRTGERAVEKAFATDELKDGSH